MFYALETVTYKHILVMTNATKVHKLIMINYHLNIINHVLC